MYLAFSKSVATGLIVSLSVAAACATPMDPPASVRGDSAELNRVVCHEDPKIGSRLPKKVCKTVREWDEEALESREMNQKRQPPMVEGDQSQGAGATL